MLRIATVTFVSHTNKPGGGELALRRYLDETSLRVRLVTMEEGGVWEGVRCEVLYAPGLPALRRSLRDAGLVVANSMRAAFTTKLVLPRRTQLIYWVRDGLINSAMSPIALGITKYVTARGVSIYLANSEWTAGTVHDALGVPPEKVEVVHSMCGVTPETLARSSRNATHIPLRLLFLGRIAPWKAPEIAIRALQPMRELGVQATLTIVGGTFFGEDSYGKELRDLVASEPAVTLRDHTDDVPRLLDSHDILVHCSVAPEPFGQVAVQALAHGLPVAATDQGGIREIVRPGVNGALYPPGDEHALARAVSVILSHYAELSSGALRTASHFLDEDAVAHLDEILSRSLASGTAGSDTADA